MQFWNNLWYTFVHILKWLKVPIWHIFQLQLGITLSRLTKQILGIFTCIGKQCQETVNASDTFNLEVQSEAKKKRKVFYVYHDFLEYLWLGLLSNSTHWVRDSSSVSESWQSVYFAIFICPIPYRKQVMGLSWMLVTKREITILRTKTCDYKSNLNKFTMCNAHIVTTGL